MKQDQALERYSSHILTGRALFASTAGALLLLTWLTTGGYYTVTAIGEPMVLFLLKLVAGVLVPLAGLLAIGANVWLMLHNTKRLDRRAELAVEQHQLELAWQREQVQARRAATEVLVSRITADDNGNYPIYHDWRAGQFHQFAPGQYKQPVASMHYSIKNDGLSASKEPQGLLPAGTTGAPTLDECISRIARNSLQLCVGRSLKTAEYAIVQLPGAHILLIGSTQKGKSTQAAAIMQQLTTTHDREHVLLALLDLEDQTCNLFADAPHVLRIGLDNGRTIKAIARSEQEVARYLGLLRQLMDERYELAPKERAALPHIVIYVEEFLELKRRLKGQDLARMADDFTSLATRGLKANMHLMVCAQASYSQEEFREAMGQLVGINMGFCAPPKLAQAAGFWEYDLLKQNFLAKVPGQFVLEATGQTDLCMAPEYQLQARLQAMQNEEEERSLSVNRTTVEPAQDEQGEQYKHRLIALPGGAHPARTPAEPDGELVDERAWQAYIEVIGRLQEEGHNQDEIILKIWHVSKGGSTRYQSARDIYRQCNAVIKQRRQEAYNAAGGE